MKKMKMKYARPSILLRSKIRRHSSEQRNQLNYLALALIVLTIMLPIGTFMNGRFTDHVAYIQPPQVERNDFASSKTRYSAGPEVAIHYSAYVVATWRHADGTVYHVSENHNILVNIGRNDSLTELFVAGSRVPWLIIQPTNASMTPNAVDTYCCGGTDKTFVTTTNLAPAAGTWTPTGTGTGTVSRTFTLTVAITVTVYGAGLTSSLSHGAGANNLRAEADLPSTAPMSQIGDNVTIVWYITQT